MTSPLLVNEPFLWDAAWQTTLFLLLGVLGSFLWSCQPGRPYRFLALTLAALLFTPLLSLGVRSLGWGFFTSPPPATADEPPAFVEREIAQPLVVRTELRLTPVVLR